MSSKSALKLNTSLNSNGNAPSPFWVKPAERKANTKEILKQI
jgi:hypothetical protein